MRNDAKKVRTSPLSRRGFLKLSAASTGALVIGFYLPGAGRKALAQATASQTYPPNAFLRIAKDNSVTVIVKHLEFGQGVTTALPMLVAEELECDWTKVRAELAPAAPVYNHVNWGMQATGGSSSVANSWTQLRTVGAQARMMLVGAAARRWKTEASGCHAANGYVHGPGNKKLSYGELAEEASKLPVPDKVQLKDPKDFRIIGKPTPRLDSADKVSGKAHFGLDMKLPDLHTAVVAHAPVFGATPVKFDAAKAKKIPGVTHVIRIPTGVAVVAKNFWAARRGRDVLDVEWNIDPAAARASTEAMRKEYLELAKKPGMTAKSVGDAGTLRKAAKTIVAEYELPYLAHAAMEPLNCTIAPAKDSVEVWVGTQFQTTDQAAVAKVFGLKPKQVKLNTMLAGGGFGRRANPDADYVVEAAEIAKQLKRPVKLVWTREDDIKGGYYRPMMTHRVEAGLDASGSLVACNHVAVGQSIFAGRAAEAAMVKNGVDESSVEGIIDSHYAIPNFQVSLHTTKSHLPVLWWRSVGHSHTAFVMESMIDEVATAAGKDPLEFRRTLLAKEPRLLAALNLAADKAGWGSALPKGRAHGIAVHESFGSVCAYVAEVSADNNEVKVHRVVAAVDCGLVINPLTVEAQIQSAIAYGLGAALHSEITVKEGKVEQSNFHDYQVLRANEMPTVEVHIVPSKADKPTGMGEPGTPPIAPAVTNALFALTGKRVRSLPIRL